MSRLDSFIRRLEAQRACLGHAVAQIRGLPGPVLELGLGNGRTYDHLRELLPGREIFVFEREVNAHPDCIPDPAHLILGDVRTTLPQAHRCLPGLAALAHTDVGTGDAAQNAELATWLSAALPPLLAPGAWVVSDQPLRAPDLVAQSAPAGIDPERYFLYNHRAK
ncbi:MAG TPA: class I SAM-dependent methyltransferase [Geminicoccaceae bacterium]|nr:class I SAM-dependent methyltransferase [Geminicoccaceae bacterium]